MKKFKFYTILITFVVTLFAFGPSLFYQRLTTDTLTAEVTDTERSCKGSTSECTWMVLTDQMSFENKDAFWHWKFNSTDFQGKMKQGYQYEFGYYGWRIPFLSIYPNLISIKEVSSGVVEAH